MDARVKPAHDAAFLFAWARNENARRSPGTWR
jgi:hypothetical protein